MISLASKVFTVTGGASGMGAATCRLLAQRGAAAIAIGDKNPANFESIKASIKDINPQTRVTTTELDVSDSAQVEKWIQDTVKTFGRLDGSANVAGVGQSSGGRSAPTILEETDEDWRRTMSVNLDGIMHCTRAQVRAMVALPKGVPRAIVNVSSLASTFHGPDIYAYGTSKRAVVHFSSSVAKDVYPFGLRVNTVSPGATLTPMSEVFFPGQSIEESSKALNMVLMGPESIARPIVWLLSEDSADVNGVNLPVGEGAP
ncbi:oxidoreductase [Cladophialophora psammophila CBS 110553]|uniref:Oxidoreductase n=1 Tax=Cladophialophora psammophila CBS 110553 TaxID=1182543 RepID=W9WH05_9EURO|nr:oxidoreductase [Cladophialophora psammophila CBS 110553]EXJ67397.1 oxidoreductase [Cladophialophora psammophila CBS 110553]